jgi:hypothetical protein
MTAKQFEEHMSGTGNVAMLCETATVCACIVVSGSAYFVFTVFYTCLSCVYSSHRCTILFVVVCLLVH